MHSVRRPFPRSIDRGPIEAQDDYRQALELQGYFRDRLIAAPLKRITRITPWPRISPFPRSIDRGPIEAQEEKPGQFIPAHFRDRLIAAPLKRSKRLYSPARSGYFRDRLIAAPLCRGNMFNASSSASNGI